MMMDKKGQRRQRWAAAASWLAAIYLTLYLVRPVCEFLKAHTPFLLLINGLMLTVIAVIAVWLIKNVVIRKTSTKVWLALIAAVYGFGLAWLKIPEEKIHFIQYGLLALLLYRALRLDLTDPWTYGAAWVLVSLCGWADEGIQYLLPNRFYDIKDVILNSACGALGLALTAVVQREIGGADGSGSASAALPQE